MPRSGIVSCNESHCQVECSHPARQWLLWTRPHEPEVSGRAELEGSARDAGIRGPGPFVPASPQSSKKGKERQSWPFLSR